MSSQTCGRGWGQAPSRLRAGGCVSGRPPPTGGSAPGGQRSSGRELKTNGDRDLAPSLLRIATGKAQAPPPSLRGTRPACGPGQRCGCPEGEGPWPTSHSPVLLPLQEPHNGFPLTHTANQILPAVADPHGLMPHSSPSAFCARGQASFLSSLQHPVCACAQTSCSVSPHRQLSPPRVRWSAVGCHPV